MIDDRLYDVSKLVAKLTTISGHTCDFATLLRDMGIHDPVADIITLLTIDHVTDITPILLKIGIEWALFICDELCAPAIVRKIIRKKIMLDHISQNHIINLCITDIREIFEAYKRGYKIVPNIDMRECDIPINDKHIALLNGMYAHNIKWSMYDVDHDIIGKNIKEIRVIKLCDADVNASTINVISACTNVESLHCQEHLTCIDYAHFADSFRNLCFMPHLRYIFADGILGDKCLELCSVIHELIADNNPYITTCNSFAYSLRRLSAGGGCGICDAGLIRCTRLKYIDVDQNQKITTCAPFAKTLRILSAQCDASSRCGISDHGLLLCTNLKKMYCNGNCNITTCAPFAKTIIVLHTEHNLLSDSGLMNCTKLRELNHTSNINITTLTPFAKTLKVLHTHYTTIGEDEIKLCNNLAELHCTDNFKTITDNPFPKSLRKLYARSSKNPDKKFYYTIKSCQNLELLDISQNYNVPNDSILPQSLTVLRGYDTYKINDTMLQSCTNLRELSISYNFQITSCTPFARTLKILNISHSSCMDDTCIQSCTNLEILHSYSNPKITIKI